MKAHVDLVLMADTHELHRELDVPPGDVLIHAGDFTMFSRSEHAIRDFNAWLQEQPQPHQIVIPCNHEYFLESDPSRRRLLSNATVFIDKGFRVADLRIWGSPVTPSAGGAFGMPDRQERERH